MVQPSSGSYDFNLDVDEIIAEAVDLCGLNNQEVTSYSAKSYRRSLNLIFRRWEAKGINYWTVKQRTIDLIQGQQSYDLPKQVLGIVDASIKEVPFNNEVQINNIAIADFQNLTNKTSEGRPSQYVYDRQITPRILVWQIPEASNKYQFTYWSFEQIEDVNASHQGVGIPPRWLTALTYELASEIALKANVDPNKMMMIESRAKEYFQIARDDEIEQAPFIIEPISLI